MAEKDTVSIRLTLDGADEVKKQFDRLKEAGESFLQGFRKGAEQAAPGFGSGLDKAIAKISAGFEKAALARDRFTSGLARVQTDLLGVGDAASTVAKRVGLIVGAATAAAGAISLISRNAIQAADEADRMADRVGLTLEQFTGLSAVAKTFDIEPGDLVGGIERLNLAIEKGADDVDDLEEGVDGVAAATERATDAAKDLGNVRVFREMSDGSRAAESAVIKVHRGIDKVTDSTKKANREIEAGNKKQNAFQKLGLDVQKLATMNPYDRLLAISDALDRVEDPARRGALAIQLLGRGAGRLISLLGNGSGSIRQAVEEIRRYGVVLDEADKKTVQLADDGLDRLSLAVDGAKMRLGLQFAPLIGKLALGASELIVKYRGVIEAVGGVAAAYAELALLDVASLLSGNDDQVSETNKWMIAVKDAVVVIGTTVSDTVRSVILPAFELIRTAAEGVAQTINAVFGTELSGNDVLAAALALKLVGAFGLVVAAGNLVIGLFNLLLSSGGLLKLLFGGLWTAVRGLAFALGWVGAALATLLGLPVGIGLAIAAAVAAAAALIYVYWDEVKAYAAATWDVIVAGAEAAWGAVAAGASLIGPAASAAWDLVVAGAEFAWTAVKDLAAGAWGAVTQLASDAWEVILGGFDQLGQAASAGWAAISTGAKAVWDSLPRDFSAARDLLVAGFEAIPGLLEGAWAAITAGATSAWDSVVEAASGLAARLAPSFDNVKGVASSMWDGLTTLAGQAWEGTVSVVTEAAKNVASAVGTVARAALDAWAGASASVEASAGVIVDAIARASEIGGNVSGARELAAALVAPFETASAEIDGVMDRLRISVDNVLRQIAEKISATMAAARNATFETGPGAGAGQSIIDTGAARAEFSNLLALFESVRQTITAALNGIASQTRAVGDSLRAEFDGIGQQLGASILVAQSTIAAGFSAMASQLASIFANVGAQIIPAWQNVIFALTNASSILASSWNSVLNRLVTSFRSAISSIEVVITRLEAKLRSLERAISRARAQASSSEEKFAHGGYVYGSGGPTQDNIPAWLSAGEFVIRAAAVKRLPLSFLRMLNSGRFDLSDLMRRLTGPRFAQGGLVGMPMLPKLSLAPSAAAAGPVSSLTLVLGGESFPGLTGPADTLARLERAVKARKIRSTGRPSPYATR